MRAREREREREKRERAIEREETSTHGMGPPTLPPVSYLFRGEG